MRVIVDRALKKGWYEYTSSTLSGLSAKANCFARLRRQTISVSKYHEEKFSLSMRHSLLCLWGLFSKSDRWGAIYSDGKRVGRIRGRMFSSGRWLEIGTDRYELWLHSRNYCSVMKNDTQIALMQKDPLTDLGSRKYVVFFSEDADREVLLLCCAFADVTFFKRQPFTVAARRRETTISVGKDKFKERINWRPGLPPEEGV